MEDLDFEKLSKQLNLENFQILINSEISKHITDPKALAILNVGRIIGKMEIMAKIFPIMQEETEDFENYFKNLGIWKE